MLPDPTVPPLACRACGVGLCLLAAGALATELLVFAGALACLTGLVAAQRIGRREVIGNTLFLGWILLCGAGFSYAPLPLRTGTPWSALHLAVLPVAVLSWSLVTDRARRAVLVTLAVVGGLGAAFACVQHAYLFSYGAVIDRLAPTDRIMEPAEGGGYKAGGLHFHRLKYAHTVVPLLLAAAPLLFARAKTSATRIAAGLLTGLVLLSLGYTYARAAWIAFAVGLVLLVVGSRLSARIRAVVAATLLTGGALLPVLLATVGAAPVDRGLAWRTALSFVRDHPFFGIGYGGYGAGALEAWRGRNVTYPYIHLDAHALWLQIPAETGLLGLALAVAMAVRFGRLLGEITPVRLAVLGVVATLGVTHNLLFHPVAVGAIALALAMGAPARASACSIGPGPGRHDGAPE